MNGWMNPENPNYEEYLKLIRISLSRFDAERMAHEGWTVERVASASLGELNKYTHYEEISKVWKRNAVKLP